MSLSARVAIGPSLRVALLGVVVATGGFIVAGVTAAACRPDAAVIAATMAVAGWCAAVAGIARAHRAMSPLVLSVSDRADIGVYGCEQPWRLVEPTMMWAAFSVLALTESDPSSRPGVVRYPMFASDIAPSDRRPLCRYLLWSLRGGRAAAQP